MFLVLPVCFEFRRSKLRFVTVLVEYLGLMFTKMQLKDMVLLCYSFVKLQNP